MVLLCCGCSATNRLKLFAHVLNLETHFQIFLIYPGRPQEYSENSIFSPLYNASSQKKHFQFSAKTDYLLDLACHWKGIKTRQHHMGNNTQLAKAPLAWHDFQNVFFIFFQFGANRRSKGWDIFSFLDSSVRDETHIIIWRHQQSEHGTFKQWYRMVKSTYMTVLHTPQAFEDLNLKQL